MRIAVTGGSGCVGRATLAALAAKGHRAVCIARGTHRVNTPGVETVKADVTDLASLRLAFSGCNAIIHLAGINRSKGSQTFERVHVEGTRNVVEAARGVGALKIITLSFLKARPNSGSEYHDTKWESERIIAESGLDYSILKAGVVFGPADGMITNMTRALRLLPVFATVGFHGKTVRPVWVGDVADILVACATEGWVSRETVAVLGPEELGLGEAAKRVGRALGRPVLVLPLPVFAHYVIGWVGERVMSNPIASVAQVKMLAEGISDVPTGMPELPKELRPSTRFDVEMIRKSIDANSA